MPKKNSSSTPAPRPAGRQRSDGGTGLAVFRRGYNGSGTGGRASDSGSSGSSSSGSSKKK